MSRSSRRRLGRRLGRGALRLGVLILAVSAGTLIGVGLVVLTLKVLG